MKSRAKQRSDTLAIERIRRILDALPHEEQLVVLEYVARGLVRMHDEAQEAEPSDVKTYGDVRRAMAGHAVPTPRVYVPSPDETQADPEVRGGLRKHDAEEPSFERMHATVGHEAVVSGGR